jgi:hypothetical protein
MIFIWKQLNMKKIVKLTESDLARIIKRVIKENQNDIPSEIMECASEVLTLSDLTKIPTCMELGMGVMTDKKMPTDIFKVMACGTELYKLNKTAADAQEFMNCVLEKVGTSNPVVMNTNESRKRR